MDSEKFIGYLFLGTAHPMAIKLLGKNGDFLPWS